MSINLRSSLARQYRGTMPGRRPVGRFALQSNLGSGVKIEDCDLAVLAADALGFCLLGVDRDGVEVQEVSLRVDPTAERVGVRVVPVQLLDHLGEVIERQRRGE